MQVMKLLPPDNEIAIGAHTRSYTPSHYLDECPYIYMASIFQNRTCIRNGELSFNPFFDAGKLLVLLQGQKFILSIFSQNILNGLLVVEQDGNNEHIFR